MLFCREEKQNDEVEEHRRAKEDSGASIAGIAVTGTERDGAICDGYSDSKVSVIGSPRDADEGGSEGNITMRKSSRVTV